MPGAIIEGAVVSNSIDGQEIRFFFNNRADLIQRHHAEGEFYEREELAIISAHFPRGGVYVDVGANIGNHVVYVGRYLRPRQIVVFEPNPVAAEMLKINVGLNALNGVVDFTFLPYGLSDRPHRAVPATDHDNLGATRFHPHDEGVALAPGDLFLAQRRVDFLKLDVEGMELAALAGLEATLTRWRPSIFVEIEEVNVEAFQVWRQSHDYVVTAEHKRYAVNRNFMLVPTERA